MRHPDPKTLIMVWIGLMVLLAITYLAYFVNLGPFNTFVAFSVAVAKALLVMLFFMELYYSPNLPRVMAGAGFVWLAILVGLSMADYVTRHQMLFNFSS